MYKSGITKMFRSIKILSAAGVVGPLAASAMIFAWINEKNNSEQSWHDTIIVAENSKESACIFMYLNAAGIFFGDHFLDSGRYKYITRLVHKIFTFVRFGSREIHDGTILDTVVFQLLVDNNYVI